MEWSNAKKFVIVLLVLLNVLLAGLNYNQNRENTMTATQERSIFEVLSRNGITMYTDLLTEHPPMSRLAVELPSYNKETLERLFYSDHFESAVFRQCAHNRFYKGRRNGLSGETEQSDHERCARCLGNESSEKRQGRDDQGRSPQRSTEIH